jgi:glycine cleavage system H lipoate-binding protein/ABC-type phosphate transport system substrate-binding protein
MKTILSTIFTLSFLILSMAVLGNVENDNKTGDQTEATSLQIVSSPELFDLTSTWVSNFETQHPALNIRISELTDESAFSAETLYLVSRDEQIPAQKEAAWEMVIGHDVVVSIVNTNNPVLEALIKKGVTAEDFAQLLAENPNWSLVVEGAPSNPAKAFVVNDQQVSDKFALYTQTEIQAAKVSSAAELISAVQQDVNAIGFCKLIDVINPETNAFAEQITLLPIDKNRNGRMDQFEQIYSSPEELTRGVWIGKYPKELSGNIYALAASEPTNQVAVDFLTWATSDGQELLAGSGYCQLLTREKTANMNILIKPEPQSGNGSSAPFLSIGWMLAIGTALVLLLVGLLVRSKRKEQLGINSDDIEMTPALNENSIEAPAGLFYDKTHTWAFMERDGLVKIGIDDFMQHLTGSLTQLKMKNTGEKIRKGEKIVTIIRDGKQLDIYSPVSGIIRQQNQSLLSTPQQVNSSPYVDGWVYQIEPQNWAREARLLFMADTYKEWLEDEFARLRDFLATSANSNTVVFEHIVLQDGGELTDNVLADLGPEVWEDFQTHFIDNSK